MNIHLNNYEEFLVDYLHGELHGALKSEMEQFMADNPNVYEEYELLQDTILLSDKSIVFENKNSLLKKEKPFGLWVSYKRDIAIAAAISGIIISLSILDNGKKSDNIAKENQNNIEQIINKPIDSFAQNSRQVTNTLTKNKTILRPKKSSLQTQFPALQIDAMKQEEVITQKPFRLQIPEEIVQADKLKIIDTSSQTSIALVPQIIENSIEPIIDPKEVSPTIEPKPLLSVNQNNQPKLFNTINRLLNIKNKVKKSTEQLLQTEVVVMVGNTKIINLNHY